MITNSSEGRTMQVYPHEQLSSVEKIIMKKHYKETLIISKTKKGHLYHEDGQWISFVRVIGELSVTPTIAELVFLHFVKYDCAAINFPDEIIAEIFKTGVLLFTAHQNRSSFTKIQNCCGPYGIKKAEGRAKINEERFEAERLAEALQQTRSQSGEESSCTIF
jgi:hypothetical protein